ncbi:MAG: hypothetical protein LBL67_03460 [Coriobacteriales bacterium]|nr:hypothetical protein [Coriobacteriales bacterium]
MPVTKQKAQPKQVQIATRVSPEIKEKAAEVLSFYGLDIPTVLRMVIVSTANEQQFPPAFGTSGRIRSLIPTDSEKFKQLKRGAVSRVNPKTGHLLITQDDPQDLQDWALHG